MNDKLYWKFSVRYFVLAILIFLIEVFIALYVRDRFIRPYFGDYLVVILVYCGVRAVLQGSVWKLAIGSLLFAYIVETMQYLRIVDRLGLADNIIAKTVIGYGFEWEDIFAYTLGIVTVILVEFFIRRKR
ncbi:MAG: DUF2809 domain-containing protein [Chitinophagaceae bacterium]|nr:MAG: DUF2809 domain-containing protein [Chitinophagaceae bacterium]